MSWVFHVVEHQARPGTWIVECWRDGEFVATVCPHEDGLHIVSKYLTAVTKLFGPPPSAVIKLRE